MAVESKSKMFMDNNSDDDVDRHLDSVGDVSGDNQDFLEDCVQRRTKSIEYISRKPKWWSRLCGNPSKSQKRATIALFTTHRLPDISHGNILDWTTIFSPDKQIWLEVGFGRGENLLALAHRKKDEEIALVGIEINRSGMGTACQRILKGLDNVGFWSDYRLYSPSSDPYSPNFQGIDNLCDVTEARISTAHVDTQTVKPYQNLRLYPGDGVKLLSKIPTSSVARILVTFPDPFPLSHEKQWRLVQVSTLKEIHRILKKSLENPGELLLATDHKGYYEWCHEVIDQVNANSILFEKVIPCPDRLQWMPAVSHYERKGWNEGRQTLLCCWSVRSSEMSKPTDK